MSYPNAYCVKCGAHTATQKKHTVVLQNNSRALKGICPACASDVYKILPKDRSATSAKSTSSRYPNAYCVRCQEHTPTNNAHTVVLENQSRAVTGSCQKCGSEVYRILGAKEEGSLPKVAEKPGLAAPRSNLRLIRAEEFEKTVKIEKSESTAGLNYLPVKAHRQTPYAIAMSDKTQWTFLLGLTVITTIVAACVLFKLI